MHCGELIVGPPVRELLLLVPRGELSRSGAAAQTTYLSSQVSNQVGLLTMQASLERQLSDKMKELFEAPSILQRPKRKGRHRIRTMTTVRQAK